MRSLDTQMTTLSISAQQGRRMKKLKAPSHEIRAKLSSDPFRSVVQDEGPVFYGDDGIWGKLRRPMFLAMSTIGHSIIRSLEGSAEGNAK